MLEHARDAAMTGAPLNAFDYLTSMTTVIHDPNMGGSKQGELTPLFLFIRTGISNAMDMGSARIFDVGAVWGKTESLGAKENRCCRTFKSEETKIPMTKESKESVIYIYSQHTPSPVYLITALPLGLSN